MMPSWLGLVFWGLRLVPLELSVVQSAMNEHWGKDHVAQAQHAVDVLQKAIAAASAGMQDGTVDANPSPVMGEAPKA
jgi:hypothetical protein